MFQIVFTIMLQIVSLVMFSNRVLKCLILCFSPTRHCLKKSFLIECNGTNGLVRQIDQDLPKILQGSPAATKGPHVCRASFPMQPRPRFPRIPQGSPATLKVPQGSPQGVPMRPGFPKVPLQAPPGFLQSKSKAKPNKNKVKQKQSKATSKHTKRKPKAKAKQSKSKEKKRRNRANVKQKQSKQKKAKAKQGKNKAKQSKAKTK